jgi:hypothetical protein
MLKIGMIDQIMIYVITIVCHQVGKRRSLPARCKRLREAASVFFLTAVFQGR